MESAIKSSAVVFSGYLRWTPPHCTLQVGAQCATIQVKFFGRVAYRVCFRRVHVVGGRRRVHTLDFRRCR